MKSDRSISLSFGKTHNWLYTVRTKYPEQYEHMLWLGVGDIEKGISLYLDRVEAIPRLASGIYYNLIELGGMKKFYDINKEVIPYASYDSFTGILNKLAFKSRDNSLPYKSYAKFYKVVEIYVKYTSNILK